MTRKPTNRAFLSRCINEAQHLDCFAASRKGPPPIAVLHEYIARETDIAWDNERGLFWVNHPDTGWNVAVWMMPAALEFEPLPNR